jgi:uncharacterized membrane protein
MSVSMLLLLAVIGLAFDLGRIYIARNEAQIYTDAAAMTAALKLDGSAAGVAKAREAAVRLPNRWNLGSQEFTGIVVEFSKDGSVWEQDPKTAAGLTLARVTSASNLVEITFLRAVGGPNTFSVPARSTAATNPVRLVQ